MEKTPESESFEKYRLFCENFERVCRAAIGEGKKLLVKFDPSYLQEGWRQASAYGKYSNGESLSVSVAGMLVVWSTSTAEPGTILISIRMKENDATFRTDTILTRTTKIGTPTA